MSLLWLVLTLLPILGGAQRFNCRGRILGAYYADAKSGCKAFHVCVRVAGGGIRDFRFFCPPGTLFHQEAQTCTDWGDDDPLACPADIYDGQFDLYKIGSGYDTKKLSAPANREDEAEFGLQRAETGYRRLAQNNGASDLRTAHSSDFFSGQRERGRDDSAPVQSSTHPPGRQSFRRVSTTRSTTPTPQYPSSSPSSPQYSSSPQYDVPKRKILRKRPVYISTAAPTTTTQQYYPPQAYSEPAQDYYNRRNPVQNKPITTTTLNIPPEYKDEYVEVSRVTPKQSKFYSSAPSTTPYTFVQTTPENKKESLVELYNYNAVNQDNRVPQDKRPFKVRNSFNVQPDVQQPTDFSKTKTFNNNYNRGTPGYSTSFPTTTVDYNSARNIITSTPAYRNFNSVSYEPEKNNYVSFPGSKQNYYNTPTSTPASSTYYTTTRADPYSNFNTVAYNTNNALNTHSSHFVNSEEDDGQYRPPQGEDDGQYRPELYERESELLSGAHSLNIAASGNRLPDDQKPEKVRSNKAGKVSTPRPFRLASSSTRVTTQPPAEYYTSTSRPYSEQTTHRAFDYYQTYTTTSRPYDSRSEPAFNLGSESDSAPKITTTIAPRKPEVYSRSYENIQPSSPAPAQSSTRPPHVPHRPQKEDSSYDYAYYDTDPGFSEYDQIEEFGRTKSKL